MTEQSKYQYSEYYGIKGEIWLRREGRRWKGFIIVGEWLEKDLRAELEEGFALAIDINSPRTNGIPLVQVERGD